MGLTQKLGTIPLAIQTDSSNNVGIGGAANASYKLDVTGTIRATGSIFGDVGFRTKSLNGYLLKNDADSANLGGLTRRSYWAGGAALDTQIFAETGYGIFLNVNGSSTTGMSIASTGSTGIGTTPPSTTNFSHLFVGRNISMFSGSSTDIYIGSNFYYDGGFKVRYSEASAMINTNAGDFIFQNSSSGTAGGAFNGVERMRIKSDGVIQIGSTSDNLLIANDSIGTWIENSNATSSKRRIRIQALNAAATKYTTLRVDGTNSQITFETEDAERMRIRSDGNVAIGSSGNTDIRLRVVGVDASSSNYAFIAASSTPSDLFGVRNDGLILMGTSSLSPFNFNPGGRVMYVNSSGQVGSNPSTRESKININPISDVSYIYDLNPVSFYFRKTNMETYEYTDEYYDEIRYGFIADEVEPLNTDLVSYDVKEDGTKKMAGVEYISMIPVLVKALQEQKKIIDELSAKVTALENK